jgi:hypothetical protein
MFSKNTSYLKSQVFETDESGDEAGLLGLDAEIPGGKCV